MFVLYGNSFFLKSLHQLGANTFCADHLLDIIEWYRTFV